MTREMNGIIEGWLFGNGGVQKVQPDSVEYDSESHTIVEKWKDVRIPQRRFKLNLVNRGEQGKIVLSVNIPGNRNVDISEIGITENEFLKRWVMHYIRPEYFWVPWNDIGLNRAKAYLTSLGVWSANSFPKTATENYDYFTWVKVTVTHDEELQKQLILLEKQIENIQQEIEYVKGNKEDIQTGLKQDTVDYYDQSISQAMQDAVDGFAVYYADLCDYVCSGMTGDKPTKPPAPDFDSYEDGAIGHAGLLISAERDRIHAMFNQPPEYPDFTPEEQRVISDGIIGKNNGVQLTTLAVYKSGVYTPPDGYDGFTSVAISIDETILNQKIAEAQSELNRLQSELDEEWRDISNYVNNGVQEHTGELEQDYCDADQDAVDIQLPECDCLPPDPTPERINPVIELLNPPWDGTEPPHWIDIMPDESRTYRYFARTSHPVSDSVEQMPWDTAYNLPPSSTNKAFCWDGWIQHYTRGGTSPLSSESFTGQAAGANGSEYGEAHNRLWPVAAGREIDYGYGPGVPVPTERRITQISLTPVKLYYNGYFVGYQYNVTYSYISTDWEIGWVGTYGYHLHEERTGYTTTLYLGYEGTQQE